MTATLATLDDPARILADATAYLEATGHLVVSWLWLEQWLGADGKDGSFYDGKRAAAQLLLHPRAPEGVTQARSCSRPPTASRSTWIPRVL